MIPRLLFLRLNSQGYQRTKTLQPRDQGMKFFSRSFHEPVGVFYHGSAVLYALGAYVLGFYGLFSGEWLVNIGARAVIGARYGYCCLPDSSNAATIRFFATIKANAWLGRFLNWICGACYGTFEDIRYKALQAPHG